MDPAVPGGGPPEATVPPGSKKAVGEVAGVGEKGDGEVAASMAAAANEEHS